MNEFMDIMRLMNNGLNNESNLKETYPRIVKLALLKNPGNIDKVTAWMLPEECFSRPHPGLNEVVSACQEVVPTMEQSIDQPRVR